MPYYLALDSGGTKTECWLADDTRVLGRARTSTVKLTRVPEALATERIHLLLDDCAAQAGISLRQIKRTCMGVAGYSIPDVRRWAGTVLAEAVTGEIDLCGDDDIALDAAFRGGPGILMIAGTGAVVLGRCADRTRITAGGWGPMIGDEGSGFWIGREALKRSFWALDKASDRAQPVPLLEAIRHFWQAADRNGVVAIANSLPSPDFAALTPVVVQCADAGDDLARRILHLAGDELAAQATIVWARMQTHGETSVGLAYTGSVVEKIPAVRTRLKQRLAASCPGLAVRDGAINALEGALWRARTGRPQSAQRATAPTLPPPNPEGALSPSRSSVPEGPVSLPL